MILAEATYDQGQELTTPPLKAVRPQMIVLVKDSALWRTTERSILIGVPDDVEFSSGGTCYRCPVASRGPGARVSAGFRPQGRTGFGGGAAR